MGRGTRCAIISLVIFLIAIFIIVPLALIPVYLDGGSSSSSSSSSKNSTRSNQSNSTERIETLFVTELLSIEGSGSGRKTIDNIDFTNLINKVIAILKSSNEIIDVDVIKSGSKYRIDANITKNSTNLTESNMDYSNLMIIIENQIGDLQTVTPGGFVSSLNRGIIEFKRIIKRRTIVNGREKKRDETNCDINISSRIESCTRKTIEQNDDGSSQSFENMFTEILVLIVTASPATRNATSVSSQSTAKASEAAILASVTMALVNGSSGSPSMITLNGSSSSFALNASLAPSQTMSMASHSSILASPISSLNSATPQVATGIQQSGSSSVATSNVASAKPHDGSTMTEQLKSIASQSSTLTMRSTILPVSTPSTNRQTGSVLAIASNAASFTMASLGSASPVSLESTSIAFQTESEAPLSTSNLVSTDPPTSEASVSGSPATFDGASPSLAPIIGSISPVSLESTSIAFQTESEAALSTSNLVSTDPPTSEASVSGSPSTSDGASPTLAQTIESTTQP